MLRCLIFYSYDRKGKLVPLWLFLILALSIIFPIFFTYDGILAPGESANFTVVFKALVNGTLLNTVNATSNETGNRTGNNTTIPRGIILYITATTGG